MFGLGLDSWNNILVASLILGALAAVIVGVSTFVIIRLQRSEAQDAGLEFERYKLATDERILETTARAKEAELALIKFRKPRSELLPTQVRAEITEKLKAFAGTKFDIGYGTEDREQADFLWWLLPTINDAGWVHIDWVGGRVFKRLNWPGDHLMGIMSVINVSIEVYPDNRDKLQPAADALVEALKSAGIEATTGDFNNSSTNNDAIHLLVGPKR